MDSPASVQRPYAFVLGSDGHVWVRWRDGAGWHWNDLGKPQGAVTIAQPVGVCTVMTTPAAAQRPYVFVLGSDNHLWVRWWEGSVWHWDDLGRPPGGTTIVKGAGVVTMMDTPTSFQRPFVFVQCSDGKLWVRWWDGAQWIWSDQGTPSNGSIVGPFGALTVMNTPASQQRPYVFVCGADNGLWVDWWSGAAWTWTDLGKPAGVANIGVPLGVLTVMDTPASFQRPYAFVLALDGNVWVRWWGTAAWTWTNLNSPPTPLTFAGRMGVLTIQDTPRAPQRPYVFLRAENGALWLNAWDGSRWNWTNHGTPTGVAIGRVGALAVKSASTQAQAPHLFARGNDGHLWLRTPIEEVVLA